MPCTELWSSQCLSDSFFLLPLFEGGKLTESSYLGGGWDHWVCWDSESASWQQSVDRAASLARPPLSSNQDWPLSILSHLLRGLDPTNPYLHSALVSFTTITFYYTTSTHLSQQMINTAAAALLGAIYTSWPSLKTFKFIHKGSVYFELELVY